jgi:Secretion system C-terminal sorting domain/FG-GAP-like repeat
MRKIKLSFLILITLLLSTALFAQTDLFKRSAIIPVDTNDVGGLGGVISGVDFDGDTFMEIYSVNNDWEDIPGKDWTPRIHKYENSGTGWEEVWSTELTFLSAQNTWPALTYGDWDQDGKMEIIFGPVNNGGGGDSIYTRLTVYESVGDGSDAMGIDNGDGSYDPNARWSINDTPDYNLRPFRWHLTDIDSDNDLELVFGARAGAERFGVISVTDIPDAGDGSEVFTLETSGLDTTLVIDGGTIYDIAVSDSLIVLFHTSGSVTPIVYTEGAYVSAPIITEAVATSGPWKSSSVVDIDNDGTKEIIVNNFGSSSPTTHLLQFDGTNFTSTIIADLSPYIGGGRLYGGDTGDIDGDGNLDFVFGTRGGSPNAAIYRLEYQGGDIADAANYYVSRIDEMLFASGGRYDVISLGNLDDDPELEIVYTGIPATAPVPLVILDLYAVPDLLTIAEAKVDADGDFAPDMKDATVTVSGVVINESHSSSNMNVFIQDPTGGIYLLSWGNPGDLKIGDRVTATGTIDQYRGLNQLVLTDPATEIVLVDTGRVILPKTLTIDEYIANAEMYEATLVKLEGVAPTEGSTWPEAGSDANNFKVWTGYGTEVIARIDKDTDVDDGAEPTWPVDYVGIATQFDGSEIPDSGYQVTFASYAEISQNVDVDPLPYFALTSPADGAVISITDSSQTIDVTWEAAIDLNDDIAGYQFEFIPGLLPTFAAEPMTTLNATDILELMAGADSLVISWTVQTQDSRAAIAFSMDTLSVTFVNDILVGVDDQTIPNKFYADQNYPNPFNPSTTIKFGLPAESVVDLRIYDVLGREVRSIVNGQSLKAGTYSYVFDASNIASGTYIYRLTTGNNVVTKKMLLLK